MSIPPRLVSKLHDVLGPNATEDFMNWIDDNRAQHEQTRADIAELRQEMRVAFATIPGQFMQLEAKVGGQMAALAKELRGEIHVVDNKIEKRFSELLLWSFVFWVGAVAAIAMLAGVLRP